MRRGASIVRIVRRERGGWGRHEVELQRFELVKLGELRGEFYFLE